MATGQANEIVSQLGARKCGIQSNYEKRCATSVFSLKSLGVQESIEGSMTAIKLRSVQSTVQKILSYLSCSLP